MEMSVEDMDGNVKCIVLDGALDIDGVPKVELQFAAVAGSDSAIVVDLSGVSYIASTGIGLLVRSAQGAKRNNKKFVLCSPNAMVDEVLRNMVINKVIPIFSTKEEAIADAAA